MSEAITLEGKRAVIVEDEGMTQMQLQRILTHAGFSIVGTARTGEDGVDIVLRERPDIVLMDIKMPGAINGLQATERILTQYQACIVIVTAYVEFREAAADLGACGYILKPISAAALLAQIGTAWEASQRR